MRLARKGRGGDGERGPRGARRRSRAGRLSLGGRKETASIKNWAAGRRRTSSESRSGGTASSFARPPAPSSGALEKNSQGHSGASLEGTRSRRSSHRYGERRSSMNGQPQVRSRPLTRALPVESPRRLPPPKLPSGSAGLGARARR